MKVMHIIRMILLIISITGYILFLTKRMLAEFAVGVTFAAISGVLFLAGILNLLPEAAILLFLGGFVCLALSFRDHVSLKNLISPGIVFLIFGGVGLFCILYGGRFADQDIFDHWGTVVQVLIRYNRFPNYENNYLPHITYPPGTACWIYYWLFISGTRSEFIQIFVQNFLFLGMAISFFSLSSKPVTKLLTAAVIIIMLCGNQELFSIQVDNILAVTALSAISFGIFYRETLNEKYRWITVWCIFLTAVKNSGLLFVFFILLLLFPRLHRRKAGLLALLTGTAALLWSKHTQLVFTNAEKSKHALSLTYYRSVLEQKSGEDISNICRMILDREFSPGNKYIWILILAVLLIAVSSFLCSEDRHLIRRLSICSVCCYCMHQAGLLGIYLVSMPLKEALRLSHYERYQKTAVVFSAGILLIAVLLFLKNIMTKELKRNILGTAGAVICCVFLVFGVNPHWNYLKRQNPGRLNNRNYFDQVISGYEIPDNSRIMVFTDSGEDPHNYFNGLCRYYFAPSNLYHATPEKAPSPDSYDYVLVLTKNEEARRFITERVRSDKVTIVMK